MNKFSSIQSFLNQIVFSAVFLLSIVTNVSAFQGGGTLANLLYTPSTISGTVGTAITSVSPVAGTTGGATSFSAPMLLTYGLSIDATGMISGTPSTAALSVPITIEGYSGPTKVSQGSVTLNITSSGGGGTLANLLYTPSTITGTVGTAITSVSPVAGTTGGATSFSAPMLTGYGLMIDPISGIISGIPNMVAPSVAITIEGYSGPTKVSQGSVTLNITSGGGGGGGGTPTNLIYTPSTITGTVGTAITSVSPVAGTTGGATSFSAPMLTGYGLMIDPISGIISGIPNMVAPSVAITIEGYSGPTKVSQGSVTLNITSGGGGGGGGTPTNLLYTPSTITGTVGTAITSVSPVAGTTGGATSFSAPMLTGYGLMIDPISGIISGTPSTAALSVAITIEGYSGPTKVSQGSVTLNITSGGGGGGGGTPTNLIYTPSTITGTVGTAITSVSPVAGTTGGATSFSAPMLTGYGLMIDPISGIISGIPNMVAPSVAITIEGYSGPTKVSQGSVTLNITSGGGGGGGGTPTNLIYTPSTITGTVGTAITSVSPVAGTTGGATSFSAPMLTGYGLMIDPISGIISGIPNMVAPSVAITIEGYSGPTKVSQGSVTLNITSGGGGGGGGTPTNLIYTPSTITGTVGTAITSVSPVAGTTGGATSFSAPMLTGYGLMIDPISGIISGIPNMVAPSVAITIEGYSGPTKVSQGSVTLNITSGGGGGGGGTPTNLIYTPSTITGTVGTAITSVSPVAGTTGGATSFSAPMLTGYGLMIDPISGIISGIPNMVAPSVAITIEGYSGPTKVSQGSVTLNITSGGGGGSQNLSYTSSPYSVTVGSGVSMTGATTTVIAPIYSSSNIPSWLEIIPSTGAINSRGFVQPGTSSTNFTVTATGSNGSASTNNRINVYEGGKINHQLGTLSLTDKTYGDAAFTLTPPTSESTASFSYSSSNTNVIQISGNTATIVGAGSATITVNQESNVTYNSSSTSATITVNKAPLTVTAENKSKTYGSANPSFTATITGFVNGQELASSDVTGAANFSTTATATSPVTNYSITPSIGSLSSNNYSFSFVNGQLDVTRAELTVIGLTANNKEYDGGFSATASGTATLNGVIGSDDVQLASTPLYTFASKEVADGIAVSAGGFSLTGSAASNYRLTQPSFTANITKKQLSVLAPSVTLSKVYDGSTSASVVSAGTLSGVLGSETVTVSAVANYDTKDVGTSKAITVVYTLGGSGAGNYTAPSNGTLSGSITAIQLGVSGSNVTLSKVYDGSTSASVVSAGTLSGVLGSETVTVSAVANYDTKDVGTSKAITVVYTLGGSGAGNYTAPSNGTLSGSITAIQLGVSGSNVTLSKVYDGSTSASVVSAGTLSGVLGSETVTVSAVANYDTKDVGTSKAITVVYTLGGSGAGNYTAPSNGTLSGSITAIQLGVSGSNVTLSKVYDGSTSASVVSAGTLSGVLGSETVTVSAVANYDTKDVGTSKAITVVYTLGGSGAGNYTAPSNGTLSGSITAIQLGVSGSNVTLSKVYDGSTSASVVSAGTLSGVLGSETVTVSAVANYDTKDVGTSKAITVVYTLGGSGAGNYTAPSNGTLSGSITAIQLGVSGSNVTLSKVYDGSTSASVVSAGTLSGVLGSETVTVSAVANYDTKDVGTSKAITVVYTLGGSGAGNYTAPSNGTLSGSITAIQLGVSGSNVTLSKVYDGSTSASVVSAGTLSGVLGSETVTVSAVANYDTKDVGTSKAITVVYTLGGSGAGNYTAPSNGTLSGSITAIQLGVSGSNVTLSKVYDGSTSASVVSAGTLSGVLGSETVTVSAVANYDTKDVGTSKAITVVYTLGGSGAGNYTAPSNGTLSGSITAIQLGVSGSNVTLSKVYDGSTSASVVSAGTLSGVLGSETVTVSAVANYDTKDVGTSKAITVVYTLGGSGAGNYTAPSNGTLSGSITAIQLGVSGSNVTLSKVYDGSTSASVVSAGTLSGVLGSETVTVSAVANYDTKDVGTSKAITVVYTLGGSGAGNYTAPSNGTLSGSITAIQLGVSGSNVTLSKVYDGSTSASVVSAGTLSGVLGSETVTVSAVANYDTKDVGTSKAITVVYTLGGSGAGNYTAPSNGTLSGSITAIQLGVSGSNVTLSKVYDGSTSASVVSAGTLSGVLGSETVTVSAVANYDTKDVGTSKAITVVYTLGGSGAGNYTAPSNGTLSGSITPIQLIASTPTITKIKFVDGTTNADVIPGNITGAITGDNIAVTSVGNYDDAEIGKNKKITVVYALSGIDKNNYQKPTDFIVNDGEIKDFPPANLLYSPSSALSSLNIPMTSMLPSNTGGKVVSYSVNPSLPTGLTINATTGVISGTRTANVSGIFNYTVTAENSGGSTTSQITLIFNTAPSNIQLSKSELYESNAIGDEVGILSTTDIDANETHSYELIEGVGADDNASFTVSGNRLLANQKFNYQTKNTYSIRIRVKDKAGLTFEKTLVVKVLELPKVVGANSSQYNGPVSNTPIISLGFGSQLQIQGSDIVSVSWSPAAGLSSTNSLNPIAKPIVTTTYTVIITHKSGSKVELKITVEVRNDYAIEPSTILTPNNDGYNDFWVIKNIDAYANNEVYIYDRNGRLLYNMKNYNNRWDGKINGRPLAAGTYYYIIRFSQQPNVNFKGFITIAIN